MPFLARKQETFQFQTFTSYTLKQQEHLHLPVIIFNIKVKTILKSSLQLK